MKNLQIKFNNFIKKLGDLDTYNIEGIDYIKVDDFIEIWTELVGR